MGSPVYGNGICIKMAKRLLVNAHIREALYLQNKLTMQNKSKAMAGHI